MIEKNIERMAKNCFQLKAWTMTLVVLIGGLAVKDTERKFIIIAFIPIIVFWLLDTYYLRLERQYRILYKTVTKKRDKVVEREVKVSKFLKVKDELIFCKKRRTFWGMLESFSTVG